MCPKLEERGHYSADLGMLLVCVLGIDRQLQEMTPEVLTGLEHLSEVFRKIAEIEPGPKVA
jgi:hypothetical protein